MLPLVLIVAALALSLLLTYIPLHFVTAFLSLSSGGMDQMAIIAKEVHADLSILICYQLFRALFISLVVPPILKVVFKKYSKAKAAIS
ncbi:AbrB family transcriptional regulator [Brevibacillus sp. NRS-1366]|uniref:AbrB family transcriptional regulator n=1 Tax=Brevibacillus sp. NRS-1366 TaxID=3233899 RepID=UPI003D228845